MEKTNIKIGILPNQFRKGNGTFDKNEAIKLSGKIAGVCYDKEGFEHLENEPEEKTQRRINMTLNNGLIMNMIIQLVKNQLDIHLLNKKIILQ